MTTFNTSIQFSYVINERGVVAQGLTCRENFVERMLKSFNKVFTKNRSERGVLVTMLEAIANELCEMLERISDGILQINVVTASGKFLDVWGQYFGELRYPNEEDARYRARLLVVLEQPKTTIGILRKIISPYFEVEPEIRELMIDGIDPASVEFPAGSVVDWIRRRGRIEIRFDSPKPKMTGIYPNVFFVSDDTLAVVKMRTFVGRETLEGPLEATPVGGAPPLEAYQAYVYNPQKIGLKNISFDDFKDLVDNTKAAGIRIYYKSGSEYIL